MGFLFVPCSGVFWFCVLETRARCDSPRATAACLTDAKFVRSEMGMRRMCWATTSPTVGFSPTT